VGETRDRQCTCASHAGRVDETLRDRRWHHGVVSAAEVNLRNRGYAAREIDRVARLRHRRYVVQPVDELVVEIARHRAD